MTSGPELHPALAPLAGLVGTWRGGGEGSYPTIDDFAYTEEVTFAHVGKPFLAYTQKTRDAVTGAPLHAESGCLRAVGDGAGLELVLAQPSGIVEILVAPQPARAAGDAGPLTLAFTCHHLATTPSAKDVTVDERTFVLDGDTLTYTMAMAAVGQPLTHHLSATLKRA